MKEHAKPIAARNKEARAKETSTTPRIPRVVSYDPHSNEPGHAINVEDPKCKK